MPRRSPRCIHFPTSLPLLSFSFPFPLFLCFYRQILKRTLTWRVRQVRAAVRWGWGHGRSMPWGGHGALVIPACRGLLLVPHPLRGPPPTLCLPTVLFKEVNTCNPATITGTLSRISLDGDEDPKLNTSSEGNLGFSSLPGNIPTASILVQVPKMTPNVVAGLELGEPPAQLEAQGPVYLCTESSLRPLEYSWLRAPEPPRESDYMVLPHRSLQPFQREEGPSTEEGTPRPTGAGEGDSYPGFVSVEHVNVNLSQPYGTVKHPYGLQFKQHPTVRQILASELSERSRTMPRTVPGSAMKVGSLEVSGERARGAGLGVLGGCVCVGREAVGRGLVRMHEHIHVCQGLQCCPVPVLPAWHPLCWGWLCDSRGSAMAHKDLSLFLSLSSLLFCASPTRGRGCGTPTWILR